jgi:hypothetical protein
LFCIFAERIFNSKKIIERVTLEYDAQNALMQSFLHTAVLAGFRIIENSKTKKKLTPFEESLEDIKHGRITKVKNIDNIIEEILQ